MYKIYNRNQEIKVVETHRAAVRFCHKINKQIVSKHPLGSIERTLEMLDSPFYHCFMEM